MKVGAVCVWGLAFWSVHAIGVADPGGAPESTKNDLNAQVSFILDHPLPESEYSESNRCVFTYNYESVEILDSRHLLFVGRRGNFWLNQLRSECLGLRKDALLIFEARDRSICDMDGFRGGQRYGSAAEFAAHCMLGHFESISQAQADLLRDALSRPVDRIAQEPKAPEDESE
jgi:hypothetical protein